MTKEQFYSEFKPHTAGAGFQAFIPTKSGKLKLSIVAGRFYYSTPREDFETVEPYYAFEVAAFNTDGTEWADWDSINDAGLFDIIGYGEHPETKEEGRSHINVFGYIGTDDIITALNNC